MKRILIDLDVLTVAFWDENKEALKFLDRVKKGEFEVYTPYSLFDLVTQWKYIELRDKIIHFYNIHSSRIITINNVLEESEKRGLKTEKATEELLKFHVKEEDAVLVIVTSLFNLDYLVTYNRTHLRNKINIINKVLRKNEFGEIEIKTPSEI